MTGSSHARCPELDWSPYTLTSTTTKTPGAPSAARTAPVPRRTRRMNPRRRPDRGTMTGHRADRRTSTTHGRAPSRKRAPRGHGTSNRATGRRIATSGTTSWTPQRNMTGSGCANSLGDLRKAGLVQAKRGIGAGLILTREPEETSLLGVYLAVEGGGPFGMHHTPPNPDCPIGFGIRPALQQVYSGLEEQMQQELARTTIADMLRDVLAQQR
ncbi:MULTISPECIES: Rrf2 family transcriptional regulator [unclassified Streptomyces]|uniref:Rrf2 family transcriptional regulator n=2 Tax=unclassified Streptomyces TaxID=2593676 RepID=UPI002E2671DD|nr:MULTISPECIES: Rrf2 family transcriptional regulator [unclassified Streptomyces]